MLYLKPPTSELPLSLSRAALPFLAWRPDAASRRLGSHRWAAKRRSRLSLNLVSSRLTDTSGWRALEGCCIFWPLSFPVRPSPPTRTHTHTAGFLAQLPSSASLRSLVGPIEGCQPASQPAGRAEQSRTDETRRDESNREQSGGQERQKNRYRFPQSQAMETHAKARLLSLLIAGWLAGWLTSSSRKPLHELSLTRSLASFHSTGSIQHSLCAESLPLFKHTTTATTTQLPERAQQLQ